MPRKTNTAKVLNADPINTDAIIVANTNENVNTEVANTLVANTEVTNTEVKTRKPRVSKKDTIAVTPVKVEAVKSANEVVAVTNVEVKPKRGRKSKMELLTALNAATNVTTTPLVATNVSTPLASPALNNTVELVVNEKEKEEKEEQGLNDHDNNDDDNDVDTDIKDGDVKTTKKRGRKPKGGKIIQNFVANETQKIDKPNIILHLKCSLKDLHQSPSCLVESYNFSSGNLNYDLLHKNENIVKPSLPVSNSGGVGINDIKGFNIMVNSNLGKNEKKNERMDEDPIRDITKYRESDLDLSRNNYSNYNNDDDEEDYDEDDEGDNKTCSKNVWRKLKQLEHNLHINNVNNKKSACFWCTCDFDNPPIYVPKHYINGTYHVYGCFCSPECGVAHLMNEPIDSSAKFERYHLLNHIYSKIYDYKKNIKPAPNPYYMLEKFYGNLSIQEYRSLLRNERLFLIVDKPLTRILPELHEDNDEFILNNKIIASNNYQLKSRMQKKKPSKGLIMNEKFGLGV
jgi:hypothetical protein